MVADHAAEDVPDDGLPKSYQLAFVNPPLSVKLIAWLFVAVGISSVLTMLIGYLYGASIMLDLGFVGIFIGRGLLHYRNGWRNIAIFFTCLAVLFCAVGTVAIITDLVRPADNWEVHPSGITGLVSLGLLGVYSVWQARVLMSGQFVDMCFLVSVERNEAAQRLIDSRGYRLSLSTLMMAVMVFAVVITSVTQHRGHLGNSLVTRSATYEDSSVTVSYRFSKGQISSHFDWLDVVVFTHGEVEGSQQLGFNDPRDLLTHRETVGIFGGCRLYEVQGGEITQRRGRVTPDELESFLRQTPAQQWTIAELLGYVERTRQAQK